MASPIVFSGMIGINDYLVSDSVLSSRFACDLKKCKGACCVEGLAGPPVTMDEVHAIQNLLPELRDRLRPEGIAVIEQKGIWEEWEGTPVLTCVNDRECVFVIYRDGIAACAIEEYWQEGKSDFRKPVSCHLFPIRVREFFGQKAVNVVENDDCKPAFLKGRREQVPVHHFLKEAIIRRFGQHFYDALEYEYSNRQQKKADKVNRQAGKNR